MLPLSPFKQAAAHCGPACLKIVLGYYGVERSERELGKLARTSKRSGTSAQNIASVARKHGFTAHVVDNASVKSLGKLVRAGIPVIVNWFFVDDGHYSVALGIDQENIYLQDPDLGYNRAMRLSTFQRVWFTFNRESPRTEKDFVVRRMIIVHQ